MTKTMISSEPGSVSVSAPAGPATQAVPQDVHRAVPQVDATGVFLRHLGEMVLAMVVGMLLLGPVWAALARLFDVAAALARPDVGAFVMATNMTAAMAVWMRHRGHRGVVVAGMGAAMYLPYLVLVVPYWAGLLDGRTLHHGGHVLMFPAMIAAMLLRRAEYTRDHPVRVGAGAAGTAQTTRARPATRVLAFLRHRWPTGLALLVTLGSWIEPIPPPVWTLLLLPGAYLAIGAARGTLRDRRVLGLQLAGLVGWLGLAVLAAATAGDLSRYLVAAGWLVHAVWDVAHHRANAVVPRGYAEFCAVVDLVVGLTIILLLL